MSTKRERSKQKHRIKVAKLHAQQENLLALEDVFLELEILNLNKSTPICLLARVSSRKQRSNLASQVLSCVERLNCPVQLVYSTVSNGADTSFLDEAIAHAQANQLAYLVAQHFDRFVRPPGYGKTHLEPFPTQEQLLSIQRKFSLANIAPVVIYSSSMPLEELARIRGHTQSQPTKGARVPET